jgi:hypothetical protein
MPDAEFTYLVKTAVFQVRRKAIQEAEAFSDGRAI